MRRGGSGGVGHYRASPKRVLSDRVTSGRYNICDLDYDYSQRYKSNHKYMDMILQNKWGELARYAMWGNFGTNKNVFKDLESNISDMSKNEKLDDPDALVKLFDVLNDKVIDYSSRQDIRSSVADVFKHTYELLVAWRCQSIVLARICCGNYNNDMLHALDKEHLGFCGPVVSKSFILNEVKDKTKSDFVIRALFSAGNVVRYGGLMYTFMPIFIFMHYIEVSDRYISSKALAEFLTLFVKKFDDTYGSYTKLAEALTINEDIGYDMFDRYELTDYLIKQLNYLIKYESLVPTTTVLLTKHRYFSHQFSKISIFGNILKWYYRWRDSRIYLNAPELTIDIGDVYPIYDKVYKMCDIGEINVKDLWRLLCVSARILKNSDEFIFADRQTYLRYVGNCVLDMYDSTGIKKWGFIDMATHIDEPDIGVWLAELSKIYKKPISPMFLIILLIYVDVLVLGNQQNVKLSKQELRSWCTVNA